MWITIVCRNNHREYAKEWKWESRVAQIVTQACVCVFSLDQRRCSESVNEACCSWRPLLFEYVHLCLCVCVWERVRKRERHRLLSAETSVPATDRTNFIWWADIDARSTHHLPKTTMCYQPSYTLQHRHRRTVAICATHKHSSQLIW